jgi:hypothetical protein
VQDRGTRGVLHGRCGLCVILRGRVTFVKLEGVAALDLRSLSFEWERDVGGGCGWTDRQCSVRWGWSEAVLEMRG